jgi:hypothetical protein
LQIDSKNSPIHQVTNSRIVHDGIVILQGRAAATRPPGVVGELLIATTIAAAIVVFRSYVPTAFERFDFDSDQAIVGLMAKHLSELRAFPLFFYGQNYMLGVQSWIAVPFFWLGGPSLAMLRLPLIIVNIAVASTIIAVFVRQGMRPAIALVAVLPLLATTPVVSTSLVEALGVSVEPLAYALLLWFLRGRPVLFGAVFGLTFLHREFAAFSLIAIAFIQWRERSFSSGWVVRAAASFGVVWLVVDLLKRTLNVGPSAPPGVAYQSGSLLLEVKQLLKLLSLDPRYYLAHLWQLMAEGLPEMLGARRHPIRSYGMISTLDAGSMVTAVVIVMALALAAYRVRRRQSDADRASLQAHSPRFTLYLALVGLQSALAYGLKTGMSTEVGIVINYVLLVLFLPVALLGAFFLREKSPRYRTAVVVLVCLWSGLNLVDNARLVREYVTAPPVNNFREIADYLVGHRIKYGRAIYWDAYVVTFMARERVILASTDKVRIPAYQARVDANADNAVVLYRKPCGGGTMVSSWCIVDPLNR